MFFYLFYNILCSVAEFCPGGTLKEAVLQRRGRLELYLQWAIILSESMDYLHSRGIVHRDFKPSNVVLDNVDVEVAQPKICDLGVAKVLDREGVSLTNTLVGTPSFLPPEMFVMETDRIDATKADVYAAGVTFFFAFAGYMPYEHEKPVVFQLSDIIARVNKVAAGEMPPMPGVDARLRDQIVYRMLDPNPSARPTFAHVGEDLKRLQAETTDLAPGSTDGSKPSHAATTLAHSEDIDGFVALGVRQH
eukprot:m.215558 g.215558  ORF g.215558 m.215558 type:complete len:248 (-) comp18640_c0_seq2:209-952(-)